MLIMSDSLMPPSGVPFGLDQAQMSLRCPNCNVRVPVEAAAIGATVDVRGQLGADSSLGKVVYKDSETEQE